MSMPNPRYPAAAAALALCLAVGAPSTPAAQAATAQSPTAQSPTAQSPTAQSPAVTSATATAAEPMTSDSIMRMLDQTINWYRTLGIQQEAASEPSDVMILYGNRQTANQVIGLAFEIARANAEILAAQPQPQEQPGDATSSQSLSQLQDKFTAQGVAVQAEMASDRGLLAKAGPAQRKQLQAKLAELQGELDLINARRSLLGTLSTFASESGANGSGASSLKAQIDAMAVTMPTAANAMSAPVNAAAQADATAGATPDAPGAAGSNAGSTGNNAGTVSLASLTGASGRAAARFGIWDLVANVARLSEKIATIDLIDARTAVLQDTFSRIRAPLISRLKAMSARGDALASQADSADSDMLIQVRSQLDALSGDFKETSALLIPLGKEGVLLQQYRRTVGNWRDAVRSRYVNALKTLGVRVGVLLVLLTLVFAAAEVWRRAVLRYVPDSRRRYQFLLLRKIALWCLVVVIVGFAFASELGSIVTFAGLITAGLAVAMQSVLVSIVGYFFLIGKYGIRVGDRVQIGEVTGEVIELGLVRLYLMELGARGLSGPTGRVVAFANSIVFQVSSGLFKQIHGVNFIWREITLTLPPGVDHAAAKDRLLSAVSNAIKDYRDDIVRQTREIRRATVSDSADDGRPRVQLIFSAAGAQARIQYPVPMQNAAETDERVSQAAFGAIAEMQQESKDGRST